MMLSRGLPISILVHAIGLVVMVMFGNYVARNPVRPSHSIKVKMVHLPRMQEQPVVIPDDPVVQPAPQKEIKPDLPPKELPKPKVDPPKAETKPQEKIEAPETPAEKPVETVEKPAVVAKPFVSGPSASDTDTDFPFAWYLSRVEGLIARNWKPRQIGFGKRAVVSCAVHFSIAKNGGVSQVTLVRNSGVGVFDRESLRAVQTTKLPPLPPQFTGPSLGVTFIFNLEPGT